MWHRSEIRHKQQPKNVILSTPLIFLSSYFCCLLLQLSDSFRNHLIAWICVSKIELLLCLSQSMCDMHIMYVCAVYLFVLFIPKHPHTDLHSQFDWVWNKTLELYNLLLLSLDNHYPRLSNKTIKLEIKKKYYFLNTKKSSNYKILLNFQNLFGNRII